MGRYIVTKSVSTMFFLSTYYILFPPLVIVVRNKLLHGRGWIHLLAIQGHFLVSNEILRALWLLKHICVLPTTVLGNLRVHSSI